MTILPPQVPASRTLLRAWEPDDAEAMLAVFGANLAFLRQWMVWALDEPMPVALKRDQLAMFRRRFDDGQEWIYAIDARDDAVATLPPMVEPRLLGGLGVHPRSGGVRVSWDAARGVPECVELGYWLREEANGFGFCTEAVRTVIGVLSALGVHRIEIRTHPENHRSRAIPQRLGFVRESIQTGIIRMPDGTDADGEVWVRPAASRGAGTDAPSASASSPNRATPT